MNDPITGKNYVTHEDLELAIDSLRSDISAMREAIDRRIDSAVEHVEAETRQRKADVRRLNDDLEMIASQARDAFERNDARSNAISKQLGDLVQSFDRLAGTMESWSVAMDSNRELFTEQNKRQREQAQTINNMRAQIDAVESQIGQQQIHHNLVVSKVNTLHKTIHGQAGEDGPDSIFLMLRGLRDDLASGFTRQAAQISEVMAMAQRNAQLIEAIQRERQLWTSRWRSASKVAYDAFTRRPIELTVVLVVLSGLAVMTVEPELQQVFIEIIRAAASELGLD